MANGKRIIAVRLPEEKARVFNALSTLAGVTSRAQIEKLIDRYILDNKTMLSAEALKALESLTKQTGAGDGGGR